MVTYIQSVAMFSLCKGVSAKALPCLWEVTPELLGVCKLWPCGYTSVTAPPVRLGTWHTAMGGGGPCSQRSEDLVGRNRQVEEACCRSRGWGNGGRVGKACQQKWCLSSLEVGLEANSQREGGRLFQVGKHMCRGRSGSCKACGRAKGSRPEPASVRWTECDPFN